MSSSLSEKSKLWLQFPQLSFHLTENNKISKATIMNRYADSRD